jgi:UPF0755 protein
MRPLLIVASIACLLLGAGAVFFIVQSPAEIDDVSGAVATPAATGAPLDITIAEGSTPKEIGQQLEDAGVIESTTQFTILVSLLGYEGKLQAGEYEFTAGTPELDAIYRLRRGVVTTRAATVIEGWRLEEVADAVAAQGIPREEFLAQAHVRNFEYPFLDGVRRGAALEGYLYPATYPIRRDATVDDVLNNMLQAFDNALPDDAAAQAEQQGLSLHEVVTLASIIEREAVIPEERPVMAQVFLRRLREGMPLEADPTVQYALAQDPASVAQHGWWNRELSLDDLEVDSPYNTYANDGLPPGPISNPRIDSITAVLQPADTNYLFFVAKPDGSHAFAETFEEHQQNVAMYQQ